MVRRACGGFSSTRLDFAERGSALSIVVLIYTPAFDGLRYQRTLFRFL